MAFTLASIIGQRIVNPFFMQRSQQLPCAAKAPQKRRPHILSLLSFSRFFPVFSMTDDRRVAEDHSDAERWNENNKNKHETKSIPLTIPSRFIPFFRFYPLLQTHAVRLYPCAPCCGIFYNYWVGLSFPSGENLFEAFLC